MYSVPATEKEKETINALVEKLNKYTEYYDKGQPLISDKEWDDCYFELVKMEEETGYILKNSPTQKVVWEAVSALNKVEHNHPMLSLNKTKEVQDIADFVNGHTSIAMLKMDGLTCSLRYVDGHLVSAETRGNGLVGEDILHNAKIIHNIPLSISYREELIVDGEIICDLVTFEDVKGEYSHPRNLAAGKIRTLDPIDCAKVNLSFIAWDVIKGFEDAHFLHQKLDLLELYRFHVVPYEIYMDDFNRIITELKNSADTFNYPIDGIVVKYDNIEEYKEQGRTEHHFKGGLAYKFYDEEYETTLIDIEWTMGRTGVLTPVAIYEDIEIDGTICNRASLHNVSIMDEVLGTAYVGQPIKVFKANMIIPQISWAKPMEIFSGAGHILDEPTHCPICGGETIIKNNDGIKTLHCSNPQCEGKLINKLDHFLGKKGLDVKGLSKATLEKLIDWGWVSSISDIFTLSARAGEWKNKPGFGEKSVNNILTAIEMSKRCRLENFISAIGIPLIGRTISKEIVKYYSTWNEFQGAIGGDWSTFDGFGPEMEKAINSFDYTEANFLVENYLTFEEIKEESSAKSMEGITFVITGKVSQFKNRDELKKFIESHGGKVTGSISSKTNYLINNDSKSTSAKNIAAQKAGIPILTEAEFMSAFGQE